MAPITYETLDGLTATDLEQMIQRALKEGRTIFIKSLNDSNRFREAALLVHKTLNSVEEQKRLAFFCMDSGI